MKNYTIFLISLFIFLAVSCHGNNDEVVKESSVNQNKSKTIIKYPYYVSQEREDRISKGYSLIDEGMNIEEVEKLVGVPDEVNDIFDKNNWNKKIGFSYVYLLQRIVPEGSVSEKKEKLVRVMFDLNGRVIKVDKW